MQQISRQPKVIHPAPTQAEFESIEATLAKRKRARRGNRVSRLSKYIPTICRCFRAGHSLQSTCDLLFLAHQVRVNKTTLMRFSRANPLLRAQDLIND